MPISDAELKEYHYRITLGEKAGQFLGNDLGQYLLRKAQNEVDAVVDAFQDADPTNTKEIIALQVKLKTALAVPQWLVQAVDEGQDQYTEYMDRKELEREEEKGE